LRRFGRGYGRGSKSVADALLGEFVLWIEVERGPEFCERFDLLSTEQIVIAAPEMKAGEMLAHEFARGQVFEVLRNEASGFLEFVEGLIEILRIIILRFFKFEAAGEGLAGGFQVFRWTMATGRAAGVGTERKSGGG